MKHPKEAQRLRLAMYNKGLKAIDLANKTGVSKGSISQYMNGTHVMGNISAEKIAETLDVSPVWLMGFDVPMDEGYYTNPDTAAEAQRVLDEHRTLFDAARDATSEQIQQAVDFLNFLKGTNPDG